MGWDRQFGSFGGRLDLERAKEREAVNSIAAVRRHKREKLSDGRGRLRQRDKGRERERERGEREESVDQEKKSGGTEEIK